MSKEREEALKIAEEIALMHVDGTKARHALAYEIAVALLEWEARGMEYANELGRYDSITREVAARRAEAQALRKGRDA